VSPRAGRDHSWGELPLERGGTYPRGSAPSSEAGPARGDFQEGCLGGPSGSRRGPCPAWLVTCMVRLSVFRCSCEIYVRVSPLFKGTPRAVPDTTIIVLVFGHLTLSLLDPSSPTSMICDLTLGFRVYAFSPLDPPLCSTTCCG
jgi:hypothetical protein